MIEIRYADIPDVVKHLENSFGPLLRTQNGRSIGAGAVSKAKWMGQGWIMWTDHFRTPTHGTTVKCFLSFDDAHQETVFRLKHPKHINS